MKIIVIDPGHGGHDPGAVGPTGLRESDVALDVSKRLARVLEQSGFLPILTRESDSFLELSERVDFANARRADLFLSIHCNSAANKSARGFEIFTTPGQTAADPFATDVFVAYERAFSLLPARKDLGDGDPDKEAKFAVLYTKCPAALMELEFISNPDGEKLLSDPAARQLMARAIANGICAHRGISAFPATDSPVPVPAPTPDPVNVAAARGHLEKALALLP